MFDFLIQFVNLLAQVITLLVIISTILSFFMSPYHPVRRTIDQIVQPMLAPIRRVVPQVGMFDFSPLILIIVIQVLAYLINSLFSMAMR